MNTRPGEPPYDGHSSGAGSGHGAGPPEPEDTPAFDAAATWVPPESPDAARPAWLPPSTRPGEPHGPAYGPPPGPYGGPYGAPPPGPYGAPPPYGNGPMPGKPRMPRWAKIVLVVGVGFYVLAALGELLRFALLTR